MSEQTPQQCDTRTKPQEMSTQTPTVNEDRNRIRLSKTYQSTVANEDKLKTYISKRDKAE